MRYFKLQIFPVNLRSCWSLEQLNLILFLFFFFALFVLKFGFFNSNMAKELCQPLACQDFQAEFLTQASGNYLGFNLFLIIPFPAEQALSRFWDWGWCLHFLLELAHDWTTVVSAGKTKCSKPAFQRKQSFHHQENCFSFHKSLILKSGGFKGKKIIKIAWKVGRFWSKKKWNRKGLKLFLDTAAMGGTGGAAALGTLQAGQEIWVLLKTGAFPSSLSSCKVKSQTWLLSLIAKESLLEVKIKIIWESLWRCWVAVQYFLIFGADLGCTVCSWNWDNKKSTLIIINLSRIWGISKEIELRVVWGRKPNVKKKRNIYCSLMPVITLEGGEALAWILRQEATA